MLLWALVNALHEDIVQLLGHCDLGMLQLGKRVHHHCIVIVFSNHTLQKGQVISRELTDALVQSVSNLSIGSGFTLNNLLDICLALSHIDAKLR